MLVHGRNDNTNLDRCGLATGAWHAPRQLCISAPSVAQRAGEERGDPDMHARAYQPPTLLVHPHVTRHLHKCAGNAATRTDKGASARMG